MIISKVSVDQITNEPNIDEILSAYAAESSIVGMPPALANLEYYKAAEEAGLFHLFAAYHDDTIIGVLCMLIAYVGHYSANIATTESIFVFEEYRKTGAGAALLREAERHAKTLGAVGYFVSAGHGSKLERIMYSSGQYRETNRVFFKALTNG